MFLRRLSVAGQQITECNVGSLDSFCKFAKRFVVAGEVFAKFSHCCDWTGALSLSLLSWS